LPSTEIQSFDKGKSTSLNLPATDYGLGNRLMEEGFNKICYDAFEEGNALSPFNLANFLNVS